MFTKKHLKVSFSDKRRELVDGAFIFSYRYIDINSIKATRIFTLFHEQKYIRHFNDHEVFGLY